MATMGRVGGSRLLDRSSYEELPLVKLSSVNTDSVQAMSQDAILLAMFHSISHVTFKLHHFTLH